MLLQLLQAHAWLACRQTRGGVVVSVRKARLYKAWTCMCLDLAISV